MISLSLEAERAQRGQAKEPEATLDEYIQEAGWEHGHSWSPGLSTSCIPAGTSTAQSALKPFEFRDEHKAVRAAITHRFFACPPTYFVTRKVEKYMQNGQNGQPLHLKYDLKRSAVYYLPSIW